MANIIQFPGSSVKLDFTRAKERRKSGDSKDQLNLFQQTAQSKILAFPSKVSVFAQALFSDEKNDLHAEELYRKAIEEGDAVADAYCNLGIIEFRKGQVTKAFDCFTQSLKADPRHLESHYNLGNLYFDQGDLRLAKMHYELALEIDPTFSNIYFNLGLALAVNHEYPAAAEKFLKYIEMVPHDVEKVTDLVSQLQAVESK